MLFVSQIFKKTSLSSTSLISVLTHIIVLIIFFMIYRYSLKKEDFFDLPEQNIEFDKFNFNDTNIFYFTLVTHTTLGYGDLVPISKKGKRLVSFHMFIILILVAFFGSN